MNRSLVTALGLALAAVTGAASAQSYGYPQNNYPQNTYPQSTSNASYSSQIDFARVVRVDPVFETYSTQPVNGPRCYERPTYVQGDSYYGDGNGNGDSYYDSYGSERRSAGTEGGRTAATVVGGIVGAVLGSKVGGGSGAYAASAIGTMVGGLAGRQIYDSAQRRRYAGNTVQVCDPGYGDNGYGNNGYNNNGYASNEVNDSRVVGYDVTYEYMGRQFVTRTNYPPGDRIRVRVDVRPE
jgi:uncharacterized protein YcfJ